MSTFSDDQLNALRSVLSEAGKTLVAAASAEFESIRGEIRHSETRLDAKLNGVEERLAAKIEENETKLLTALATSLGPLELELHALRSRYDALAARVYRLEHPGGPQ
jgi:hypothetical protein